MSYLEHVAKWLLAIIVCIGFCSCGTIQEPYKPAQIGTLQDGDVIGGLEITLQPDRSSAKIGDLITFSIKIKNVGTHSVRVPSEPEVLLTWVYPDGKRDNFIQDGPDAYSRDQTVQLDAGDELLLKSALTTYYFDRGGITEFRAKVSMKPHALADASPTLQDDFLSNGYGVLFEN